MRNSKEVKSLSDSLKHQVECEETTKKIKKSLDNSLLMWYYCKALKREARKRATQESEKGP
jgi:hypothetical protein